MTQTIKRAIWSFWTKPFQTHRKAAWLSKKHHLLSWVLSFERARKHYPETVLITDDDGARMLIDQLGLEFGTVSTDLNALKTHDPDWWVSGKLYAYRTQGQPFIHLDSDVFLWKPLPKQVTSAPIFAQSPEYFSFGDTTSWYRPEICTAKINSNNGWLPAEWNFYVTNRGNEAVSCGILGGNRVDFINYYADTAIQLLESRDNQFAFSLLNKRIDSLLIEQYFLAACIAYHQSETTSSYHDIDIQYLFNSPEEAFTAQKAKEVGYTHLIAESKQNQSLTAHLERRVAQDYPEIYERVLNKLS